MTGTGAARWPVDAAGREVSPRQAVAAPSSGPDVSAAELEQNIAWLIQLRWIAVVGICAALMIADWTAWTPYPTSSFAVAAGLALFNTLLWVGHRTPRPDVSTGRSVRILAIQLHVDLVALALLVRLTGGIANPFALFCVFPVAIGAMLLPARPALLTALSALVLYAGLVVCDITSAGPHQPLPGEVPPGGELILHPVYAVAFLTAAAMTLLGIVFFVHSLARQHRQTAERQRQHERIARSRQRLARVGQIAAGVAHSVRNPLHGVLNCLDLVRDDCQHERTAEHLDLMHEGLRRIETVTSRLLALTRDAPLAPQAVDVNEQILDVLGLLEIRLQRSGVELRMELGTVPEVRLDPVRFHEALFNILDNAIAAVEETSERQVQVRTTTVREPFPAVCLEVEDTGEGVDEATAAKVFDPFFSTKAIGEGSGLGLAIAREVIEEHGGVIRFLSTRGVGTTIRILLPVGGKPDGVQEAGG